MKKTLSLILCICTVISLITLSSCGKKEEVVPVELSFISKPATGYSWRVIPSREGVVEIKERFEEDENDREDPKSGYQIFTVTPVGKGEVTLDFAYVAADVEKVELAAIYVYTVDKNLKMSETHREGTYFDLDNAVPKTTYVIRLNVDGTGNRWKYETDAEGIVEVTSEYEENPYATQDDKKKGEQIFTVMGMKEGLVTIKFTYCDENGENITNDAEFLLLVGEKLIVKEQKHSGTYYGNK